MATLEMVRLRSAMPHTGLVTLRYPILPFNELIPDAAEVAEAQAAAELLDADQTTTTPQVLQETAARKGGEAR